MRSVTDSSQLAGGEVFEISLLDLAILLARAKWFVIKFVGGCTLAAIILVCLLPNKYTAKAIVLPPGQNQSAVASLFMGQLGMLGSMAGKDLGLKNPTDLYVGLLKSQTVSDSIVQRFDLLKVYRSSKFEDARKRLEKASDILPTKESMISVSVTDKDPRRAADLANAYVDELQKLNSSLAVTEASRRRLFFERQLVTAKDDLANAETELKQTQERTGLLQLDSQAKAIIATVANVKAQIAATEVRIQGYRMFATEHNPDLRMAQEELTSLRSQLTKLLRSGGSNEGDVEIPTQKVPSVGMEYIRRYREVKYREALFEMVAKQLEIAKLDEAKEGTMVQVVDRATVPERKSSPYRLLIVACALFGSFVLASLFVFAREWFANAAADPEKGRRLAILKADLLSRR